MTRITYDRLELKVTIEGHANHDEIGKDIVCAGISSLTYTLAMYVDKLNHFGKTLFAPNIRLGDGNAEINVVVKGGYELKYLIPGDGQQKKAGHFHADGVFHEGDEH
jgi:uncharacterized protein YsxB (DUF464 family)